MEISTRKIAYTSVMTAFVAIATLCLSFKTGVSNTNLGDTLIFVTAALFGPFPAMIAGGLGSFIADAISYPVCMFYTLPIKGLEGLIAGYLIILLKKLFKNNKFEYANYTVSFIIAGLWMVLGYFIAKTFGYGNYKTAMTSLPRNFIQAGISLILANILILSLKKVKIEAKY